MLEKIRHVEEALQSTVRGKREGYFRKFYFQRIYLLSYEVPYVNVMNYAFFERQQGTASVTQLTPFKIIRKLFIVHNFWVFVQFI